MKSSVLRRVSNRLVAFWYVLTITLFAVAPGIAHATSSIAYGGSSVSGDVEDVIMLPGVTVSSTDPTVPVSLSIDDGILSMATTTGLTFTGSSSGKTISFSGSVADVNAALATLQYRSLKYGSKTLTATLTNAGVVFNPANGHFYEAIDNGSSMSWDDAKIAAESQTRGGVQGYLATITSQEENDYLLGKLLGDGWFGASDSVTEDDWQWVTGPESGTSFWAGLGDGAPVGGLFSNWSSGEPNNSGDEDCAQFYSSGTGWNDLPCSGPYLDYYIVEYGAPGDLPDAPESVSFTVNIAAPTANSIVVDSCLDILDLSLDPPVDRYNNVTLANDIDCTGETVTPLFSDVDPDFGMIGYRGIFDGNGYEIMGLDINQPSDSNIGLFAYTSDASFKNLTITGQFIGNDCVGSIAGSATNTSFENITLSSDVQSGNENAGGAVGCYEGNDGDHSAINISITGSTETLYQSAGGIFGYAELYEDSTFTIDDSSMTGDVSASDWAAGGFIGYLNMYDEASFEIKDSTSTGIESPTSNAVGGLIGYAYSEESATVNVDNASTSGTVIGSSYVGGLIGELYNYNSANYDTFTIQNSESTADVSSTDSDNVGGFAGYAENVYIYRSASSGNVVSYDDEAGGFIGESYGSFIFESHTSGTVTSDDSFAGGLTGRNSETTISSSYSTADVYGDDRVGGLVGANGGYIMNSFARGSVTGNSEVGGLAGRCGRDITDSYSTGEVNGSLDVGGFLGYSDGCDVVDSFWDTETSLQGMSGGDENGLNTEDMKTEATYTVPSDVLDSAWDFTNVWGIRGSYNDGYPCLRWEDSCGQLDDDDDGITSVMEDESPNGGDGNDDGIADKLQVNVSSLKNPVTETYATLAVDNTCQIDSISAASEDSNAALDPGFNYPAGLLDFVLDCATPGFTATVTQYFYGIDGANLILRKYNSVNQSYTTVLGAVLENVTIGGQQAVKVTYSITDGGFLDEDGAVNGAIIDPSGVALSIIGAPNTGVGGMFR